MTSFYIRPVWGELLRFFLKSASLLLCCSFSLMNGLAAQTFHNGHSHNDYEHPKPLFGAIDHGFRSLEIDIYLKKDRLVVSHIPVFLGWKPTLEKLYLEPIRARIKQNNGLIYPNDSTSLILYLDFKTEAGTFEKVKEVLGDYMDLLTTWENGKENWGPVKILIDHHEKEILSEPVRWAQIQKGWDQADVKLSPAECPRLNGSFRSLFSSGKNGKMKAEDAEKLKEIVQNAHENGRTLRLYAAGNNPKVWKLLLDAGVDWINADRCKRYQEFYAEYVDKYGMPDNLLHSPEPKEETKIMMEDENGWDEELGLKTLKGTGNLTKGARLMLNGVMITDMETLRKVQFDKIPTEKLAETTFEITGVVIRHHCGPHEQCLQQGYIDVMRKVDSISWR